MLKKILQMESKISQKVQIKPYSDTNSVPYSRSKYSGINSGTQSSKKIEPSCNSSPMPKQVIKSKMIPVNKKQLKPKIDKVKQQIKQSLANVIKVYYPQKKTCLDISITQTTKQGTTGKDERICKNDFIFQQIIGQGGYGKVWKVQHNKTRKLYALKQMQKARIILKKSVDNILNEKAILQKINNNFISNIHCAFNNRDNIYLLIDLLSGGDLRNLIIINKKIIIQNKTKFIIACIIISLEYIHKNKIFHRDIKPENLVFDQLGYLRLTDFGIARCQNSKQNLDASGTPGYMAPQVLCKQSHTYTVDYYAVGIITYQLMFGKRPYTGSNRAEIRDAILAKQHVVKKTDIPKGWSVESADFINKLILRQQNVRLGAKQGVKQLKGHPWFKGYQWAKMEQKKIPSPFKTKTTNFVKKSQQGVYCQALMQCKLLQKAEQKKLDIFANYQLKLNE